MPLRAMRAAAMCTFGAPRAAAFRLAVLSYLCAHVINEQNSRAGDHPGDRIIL